MGRLAQMSVSGDALHTRGRPSNGGRLAFSPWRRR
jgi:hypothetical protein